ncbi:unnamed protein product [Nyctereutes procyonoides]|uniref:(raccoon dog) hypothetical protein n=1 Tax=Nyctereutes procyonoides TaxID=34880 RepID=A0A811ZIK8_NYCPR|nr:unnamed protein product [Nyctereutes procyonoides]
MWPCLRGGSVEATSGGSSVLAAFLLLSKYTFLNCSNNPGIQVQLIQIHFFDRPATMIGNFPGTQEATLRLRLPDQSEPTVHFADHTEREREAETQAEGEAGSMHREPDVGFDPGSPGSRPGPKAGAKPLRHPGIPAFTF